MANIRDRSSSQADASESMRGWQERVREALPQAASLIAAFPAVTSRGHPGQLIIDTGHELAVQHQRQWSEEDASRADGASAEMVASCKRLIDDLNARRVMLVEQIDDWVAREIRGQADASLHTETFGSVVDKMAIAWVRVNSLRSAGLSDQACLALRQLTELAAAYDDPESSRSWQLTRSRALIEARGGVIVAEFFDIDKSRSIPWQRRPEADALLAELKNPGREFDAVVIGEPHRAFYGNQYGLTFPIFDHYGVPLWVPEVGGPIDPANEAHDLVMSVFGGMSKGERNRVKIRVRTAMAAQAQIEGRFLGGRPPYGYVLVDAGPHPNPAKAADGKRMHKLDLDPETAPVVRRIFAEFIAGRGIFAIAEGLTRDGIPSPSAHDPARNTHRTGIAWSKGAVRAILTNPRYTGYQVWNRQRTDEVLLDVENVALGHTAKMRWNAADQWVFSEKIAHPLIIIKEDFELAQATLAGRGSKSQHRQHSRPRSYPLRGVILCGLCGRRMSGKWNNGQAYYLCRFPAEYALANKVDHPKNVYLREADVLGQVDDWLAELFGPAGIDATLSQLAERAAQFQDPAALDRAEDARAKIAEYDAEISQYRESLKAGQTLPLSARGSPRPRPRR